MKLIRTLNSNHLDRQGGAMREKQSITLANGDVDIAKNF